MLFEKCMHTVLPISYVVYKMLLHGAIAVYHENILIAITDIIYLYMDTKTIIWISNGTYTTV